MFVYPKVIIYTCELGETVMKIGYVRISTIGQNEARQVELFKSYKIDKVFIDKCSGKNADRPQLKEMLAYVREGDELYVESISRIARNTKDLLNIIEDLKKKNVVFISFKENIDTSTTTGKFMLTVFGALAEMEREVILERQRESIELAKNRGVYTGRAPMKIDKDKFNKMVAEWKNKQRTATSIMKEFNITGTTFYRWIKSKQYVLLKK